MERTNNDIVVLDKLILEKNRVFHNSNASDHEAYLIRESMPKALPFIAAWGLLAALTQSST